MQGKSRRSKRCGSETRNSPIDAGLENHSAEDQETQVYLLSNTPSKIPKIRHMPLSRYPSTASARLFSIGCKWPLDSTSEGQCMDWSHMQSIATLQLSLRIERSDR